MSKWLVVAPTKSSTYVMMFGICLKIIWQSFENDAEAPFSPCGILAQLYWAFLKGRVNEVNFCDSFSKLKQ